MSTAQDTPTEREALDLPRTNPVPLVIAAVVALVILGGLAVLLFGGGDDEVPDISDAGADGTIDAGEVVASGEAAPDVGFDYLQGSGPDQPSGRFADFRGQPLVVNFFAEWCAPCVAEMPDIQTVFEEYGTEVGFLGIATNDTRENAHRIIRQTGVGYTVAHDPAGESVLAALEGFVMPTTAFLDADGNVVRIWSGQISADELRQVIEQDLLV